MTHDSCHARRRSTRGEGRATRGALREQQEPRAQCQQSRELAAEGARGRTATTIDIDDMNGHGVAHETGGAMDSAVTSRSAPGATATRAGGPPVRRSQN